MSRKHNPAPDPLAQRSPPAAASGGGPPVTEGPLFAQGQEFDPPETVPGATGQTPREVRLPKEGTLSWRIYRTIRTARGPLAIWQVATLLRLPDHCISQRFSELVGKGVLMKTGTFNRRPISNKSCELYDWAALTPADAQEKLARDASDDYDALYDRHGNLRPEWTTVAPEPPEAA